MKKLPVSNINKLSACNRKVILKKLNTLQQLITKSNIIAKQTNQIAQKLKLPNFIESQESQPISSFLWSNKQQLKFLLSNSVDVNFRKFTVGKEQISALIIFVDGLINKDKIDDQIMKLLMNIQYSPLVLQSPDCYFELKTLFQKTGELNELSTIGEIINTVLSGDTVLLIDGTAKAFQIATKGWEARKVSEPTTEGVVRGPREGFTETIRTNTALLRRRIKSSQFKLEKYIVGRITKTEINLAYLQNTVDDKVITEVRKRIERIDVDSVLESAYIEELIEDTPYTVFPQIEHSERPDKVAAAILEGRIAILVDGTPFVLIVPTVMSQFWQSCEDYYERYPVAFFVRIIRFVFSMIALLLPGIYVAITSFHQEMLPTSLFMSIAAAREGVPFPVYVEVLIMEITFESLREAGVRLPKPVGQAVSIVGALVIGDAAVRAGIASPATVIIVALTGIASFSLPSYNMAWSLRLLRFVYTTLGILFGLYGIMLGLLLMLIHITSLRSFGVPYCTPFAPFVPSDFKDALIRAPWWAMTHRPYSISRKNPLRQKFFLKPHLPDKGNE